MKKLLINKLLITRGKIAVQIPEEAFETIKYHRAIDVALFRRLFWDKLRKLRNIGGLSLTNTSRYYDRVVHLVSSLEAQYWVLTLPNIYLLFFTLHTIKFYLKNGFEDSDCSYGSSNKKIFQGLFQGNVVGLGLWIYTSTFFI